VEIISLSEGVTDGVILGVGVVMTGTVLSPPHPENNAITNRRRTIT